MSDPVCVVNVDRKKKWHNIFDKFSRFCSSVNGKMVNNLFAGENFCTTFPINAKISPCQSDWYASSNWRWMTERFGLGGCLNFPGPGRPTSHKPNPPKSFQIIVTPLPSNAAATQIQNCSAQEIQSPMMNEIRFMKQSKSKWLSSNDQSGRATNPNGYAEEIRFLPRRKLRGGAI